MQVISGSIGKEKVHYEAKVCKCSQDTALRDIHDLVNKEILYKLPAGGRIYWQQTTL